MTNTVLQVGNRIQIISRQLKGKILYIGHTSFSPGIWYGIALDVPKGKHNGTVQGISYFKCRKKCGLFVRRTNIELTPKASNETLQQALNLSPDVGNEEFDKSVSNIMRTANFMDCKLEAIKKELHTEKLKEEIETLKKKHEIVQEQLLEEKMKNQEQQKIIILHETSMKDLEEVRGLAENLKCKLKRVETDCKELEKSKQLMETEYMDLEETTERVIIEKELAEDSSERNSEELELTKTRITELEIHLAYMKTQNEILCHERQPIRSYVRRLERQNDGLKYASSCLYSTLSSADDKILQLEDELSVKINLITTLQNHLVEYEECIQEREDRIKELIDTMDAIDSSDEILNDVIHKNQALENQIVKYESALRTLEREVETLENSKKKLQERIQSQENELQNCNLQLWKFQEKANSKQEIIQDQNDTLQKFRNQVQMLRFENENLKDMLEQTNRKLNETSQHAPTQNANFEIKKLKEKNFWNSIKTEKLEIEIDAADMQLHYWSKFLPETFFSYGEEHEAIQMMVLVKKLLGHTHLMTSIIKNKFLQLEDIAINDAMVRDNFSFGNKLYIKVLSLQITLYELQDFLEHCEIRNLLMLGTLYLDTRLHTRIFEAQLTALSMDQTREQTNSCCSRIERVTSYFRRILEYCNIRGYIKSSAPIKTFLKLVETASGILSFELSLLERAAATISHKIVQMGVHRCTDTVSDISNENNRMRNLMLLNKRLSILLRENASGKMRKIIEYIEKSLETIFSSQEEVKCMKHGLDNTGYQLYCPSPMYILKLNLKIFAEKLREFSALLNEHLINDSDHEKNTPTIITRAQEHQNNQTNLVNNLKFQLECCGKRINTLQRELKIKNKTINQLQFHKQELEKKLEKMHQQSEITMRENFKVDAVFQTKQMAIDYRQEYMSKKIRFLQRRNEELSYKRMSLQLSKLPPLNITSVMMFTDQWAIKNLHRKILILRSQIHDISIPMVVNIQKRNAGNSYKRCFGDRIFKTASIVQKIEQVRVKLLEVKSIFQGKAVVGDFRTYPNPHNAKQIKNSNALLAIRIPTNGDADHLTSVSEEFGQIKGIFQMIK